MAVGPTHRQYQSACSEIVHMFTNLKDRVVAMDRSASPCVSNSPTDSTVVGSNPSVGYFSHHGISLQQAEITGIVPT
jgi:hypothetical protein